MEPGMTITTDLRDDAAALHRSGLAALRDGRPGPAARLLTDALARRHAQGLHEDVAVSLECVAQVVADADGGLAAELLGAAAAVRDRHGVPVPPELTMTRAAAQDGACATVGERHFTRAVAAGRVAPLDRLVQRSHAAVASLG